MEVFTEINIDLAKRKFPEQIHAMQLDANTRVVAVSLYDSGMPWDVPDGVSPSVAFRKSDGKGGWYSELPDETAACTVDGNEVTVTLAPEVLTCAGKTEVAIVLQDSETLDQIASFPFDVIVTPNPAAGEDISNNYFEYKTMADVNEALIGFREEIRAFGVEIGEFSGSLRPTRYSLTASGAQTEGWNSIRDLPVGRIYRIPSGNHPPEGFGLPYKGAKQSTLVVIGSGESTWYTLYICAVRDGEIYFAYDNSSAAGDVVWQTLNAGDIIVTDTGSEAAPLELSKYGIKSGSVVRFLPGASYVVAPFDLTGAEHVQIHLNGATVTCAGNHFLRADGCGHLKIRGGTVLGGTVADADGAFHGIELCDCKNAAVEQVVFRAMGTADMKNAMGLHLLGDCTGFSVDRCTFRDITAGQIGADGFIHAFGLVVNLKDDDYSRNGKVSGCMFRDIAALDVSNADGPEKKGDGDGIFIQRHPYLDGELLMGIDQDIVIEGCSFEGCKKRGVKSAAYGTHIRDCRFDGAFWLAPVEFQFGHGSVRDCHIVNTSDYNGSVTCGIAVGDGGVTVEDSYISCPYGYTYHPGIRLKSRHDLCVYGPEAAWDPCVFRRCRLDGVNYGICSFQSGAASQPYTLSELVVEDCQIGRMNRDYGVFFDGNLIGAIRAVKVVGLRFEHGGSYDEVLEWFRETYGEDHVYWFKAPVGILAQVTDSFHVYSRHWRGAGVEQPFPVVRDTKVLYVGGEEDTVRYLEHRGFGSRACGHGAPANPVLYHSRVGDEYTDLDTGDMYVCVEAGTDSDIGTWRAVGVASFVTPQMFGAVGDGETDDTEAFKECFKHTNIHIPAGEYIVKETIEVLPRTNVTGDGQYPSKVIFASNVEGDVLFNVQEYASFSDINIGGSGTTAISTCTAIVFPFKILRLHNVRFRHLKEGVRSDAENVLYNTFVDCTFSNVKYPFVFPNAVIFNTSIMQNLEFNNYNTVVTLPGTIYAISFDRCIFEGGETGDCVVDSPELVSISFDSCYYENHGQLVSANAKRGNITLRSTWVCVPDTIVLSGSENCHLNVKFVDSTLENLNSDEESFGVLLDGTNISINLVDCMTKSPAATVLVPITDTDIASQYGIATNCKISGYIG